VHHFLLQRTTPNELRGSFGGKIMSYVIGFIAIGATLGVLAFPAFALVAVACSILYSICNFNGTILGFFVDLLGASAALQIGYFLTVLATILYRRIQPICTDDQRRRNADSGTLKSEKRRSTDRERRPSGPGTS
jgi:hypothetical protein